MFLSSDDFGGAGGELIREPPPSPGFLEGYQTMDTIAALNFGIIIALKYKNHGVREDSQVVRTTIHSLGMIMSSYWRSSLYNT